MNIFSFCKTQVGDNNKNKIKPIDTSAMKYYELLQTVNKGSLLTGEEIRFISCLSKDKVFIILKLYNINFYNLKNNIIHVDVDVI